MKDYTPLSLVGSENQAENKSALPCENACCCCLISIPLACIGCCCTLCCILVCILLGLVLFPTVTCFMSMGINGVPLGYLPAVLAVGGLNPMPRKYTCIDTIWTPVYNWTAVVELGREVPAKQWSGEWWRGNELGYLVNNPVYWSTTGIWPQSNLLGSTASQHSTFRPYLVDAFTVTESNRDHIKKFVRNSAKAFLEERRLHGKLAVQTDLLAWVHQVIFKITFDSDIDYSGALDFVALQQSVVKMGTISQALPSFLYGLIGTSGVTETISKYMTLVEDKWGDQLADEDCSPSPNCSIQVASALWDAIYSAGGLSVPQILAAGLGVLYSTDDSNPSKGFTIPPGKEAEFFWECTRYYPPVVGFPHWRTRPTCYGSNAEDTLALNQTDGKTEACKKEPEGWFSGGFPQENQFMGGHRYILDLPSAMWDKAQWGDEADKFHLFSLEEYEKNSVGFAEMAVDDNVQNGTMNRVCPGRELALIIGTTFWEEFDKSDWVPDITDIALKQAAAALTVSSFNLIPYQTE